MSLLLQAVSRLFIASSTSALALVTGNTALQTPPEREEYRLPPRLHALVTNRYPSIPSHLDLAVHSFSPPTRTTPSFTSHQQNLLIPKSQTFHMPHLTPHQLPVNACSRSTFNGFRLNHYRNHYQNLRPPNDEIRFDDEDDDEDEDEDIAYDDDHFDPFADLFDDADVITSIDSPQNSSDAITETDSPDDHPLDLEPFIPKYPADGIDIHTTCYRSPSSKSDDDCDLAIQNGPEERKYHMKPLPSFKAFAKPIPTDHHVEYSTDRDFDIEQQREIQEDQPCGVFPGVEVSDFRNIGQQANGRDQKSDGAFCAETCNRNVPELGDGADTRVMDKVTSSLDDTSKTRSELDVVEQNDDDPSPQNTKNIDRAVGKEDCFVAEGTLTKASSTENSSDGEKSDEDGSDSDEDVGSNTGGDDDSAGSDEDISIDMEVDGDMDVGAGEDVNVDAYVGANDGDAGHNNTLLPSESDDKQDALLLPSPPKSSNEDFSNQFSFNTMGNSNSEVQTKHHEEASEHHQFSEEMSAEDKSQKGSSSSNRDFSSSSSNTSGNSFNYSEGGMESKVRRKVNQNENDDISMIYKRITALNELASTHRASQVVLYGWGASAHLWLRTPPPPPVTIFLIYDAKSSNSRNNNMADYQMKNAIALLPQNVNVKQVKTNFDEECWDSDLIENTFDWELPSLWIIDLDIASNCGMKAYEDIDAFLRIVYSMTDSQSTILVTYPGPTPRNGMHGREQSDGEEAEQERPIIDFTPRGFERFVGRRSFRVLSDRKIEETGKLDLRVASLTHKSVSYVTSPPNSDVSESSNSGSNKTKTIRNTKECVSVSDETVSHSAEEGSMKGNSIDDTDVQVTCVESQDERSSKNVAKEQEEEETENPSVDTSVRTIQFGLNIESIPRDRAEYATGVIVIGSDPMLGCWSASEAQSMHGDIHARSSKPNIHKTIVVRSEIKNFEYKYALVNAGGEIVAWEEGANRLIHEMSHLPAGGVHELNESWHP